MMNSAKRWLARTAFAATLATLCGAGAAELLANSHSLRHYLGYGECYSCDCKKFEGSDNYCDNCGHNYSRHY